MAISFGAVIGQARPWPGWGHLRGSLAWIVSWQRVRPGLPKPESAGDFFDFSPAPGSITGAAEGAIQVLAFGRVLDMENGSASQTRASLLSRLRKDPGDSSAWDEFVDRYGPRIRSWCRRWGLQEADAEDVTQIV